MTSAPRSAPLAIVPLELPAADRYDLPVPETAQGWRTRARIVAAAEAVFGELGYQKASITAITQGAGVAQGSFYNYFPSKHAVFVELIKDFASRVRQALAGAIAAMPQGANRADVERRGLEAFFQFTLEHPGLYRVMREAEFAAPETYRWYYESFVDAYVKGFGILTPDPPEHLDLESLGYAMMGLADMLGLRWAVWERRLPPDAVMAQLSTLLARGFEGLLGH